MATIQLCQRGHEYTSENTYLNGRGHRRCITCRSNGTLRKHVAVCLRGHPLIGPNISVYRGRRICPECAKAKAKRYRDKMQLLLETAGLSQLRQRKSVEERFWEKVDKTGDCWLWQASKNGVGYGAFSVNQTWVMAHRFSYELAKGPIPAGMVIDHICRVRACVRPEHLDAVSFQVNVLRAVARTHCPQGHLYTPDNLYVSKGHNKCRECHRKRSADYYRRKMERIEFARGLT